MLINYNGKKCYNIGPLGMTKLLQAMFNQTKEGLLSRKAHAVDLLVLTSFNQLLFILKILIIFFTK